MINSSLDITTEESETVSMYDARVYISDNDYASKNDFIESMELFYDENVWDLPTDETFEEYFDKHIEINYITMAGAK